MYLLKTKNDKNYLVNTKAKHIHEEESNDEEESFNFFESSGDPENDESDTEDHAWEERNDSLAKLTEEMENIERGVRPSVGNIRINENTLQDIVNKNLEGDFEETLKRTLQGNLTGYFPRTLQGTSLFLVQVL